MQNEKRDYVITLTDLDTGKETFLYNERDYGYVISQYSTLDTACFFTLEEGHSQIAKLLAQEEPVSSNGIKYPPDFIFSGLGMGDKKPKARGKLALKRIVMETVTDIEVSGEIKRPTGFTYD